MALTKLQRRNRIKNRIRKVVSGTAARPRLSVFRSNKGISAQLIDDVAGNTLVSISSLSLKDAEGKVATVLVQLANDQGRIRQGAVEIEKLPLQQDLANMAGTSRETISRTLHSFAKKGLIELEGSKLRIYQFDKFKATYL